MLETTHIVEFYILVKRKRLSKHTAIGHGPSKRNSTVICKYAYKYVMCVMCIYGGMSFLYGSYVEYSEYPRNFFPNLFLMLHYIDISYRYCTPCTRLYSLQLYLYINSQHFSIYRKRRINILFGSQNIYVYKHKHQAENKKN